MQNCFFIYPLYSCSSFHFFYAVFTLCIFYLSINKYIVIIILLRSFCNDEYKRFCYTRRVFDCTEPELALRTRASIKNQQTGKVYVNVLFLDILIFCNEIISYNNCAYNKVFRQIFIVIKVKVNRQHDCFIDLSQICFDFRN